MGRMSSRLLVFLAGVLIIGASGATDRASTPSLDQALQAEFDATGAAMQEELAHQAQGDFLGAVIAKKAMQEHRARYLDLWRRLQRRLGNATSAHPDGATQDPFAQEPAVVGAPPSMAAPGEGEASPRRSMRLVNPRWDMYRTGDEALEEPDRAGATEATEREAAGRPRAMWGMYGGSTTDAPKRAAESVRVVARPSDATAEEILDAQPPTKPFLVYRNPQARDSGKRGTGAER